MSKHTKQSPPENQIWTLKIYSSDIQYLEGRVLTIIETLGLSPSQEKASKDLLRTEIWNLWKSESLKLEPFPEIPIGKSTSSLI